MSEVKIIGDAVKNMPWQEGPAEFSGAPVWRYGENPIIGRNPVKEVARIFNSAVMPYGDEFIGVFRGEQTNGIPYIYLGRSKDAIHWNFDENKIQFVDEEGKPFMPVYAYPDSGKFHPLHGFHFHSEDPEEYSDSSPLHHPHTR